jgi:hypothetical protein
MAEVLALICPAAKAEYFLFRGLTPFLKIRSDLPVGLICRTQWCGFDLPWRANQLACPLVSQRGRASLAAVRSASANFNSSVAP